MAITWNKLFDSITFGVCKKTLPKSGNLVYEYNPLRNYRLVENMYEYKGGLYSLDELWKNFGITINCFIKYDNNEYKIVDEGNYEDTGELILNAFKDIYERNKLE